MKRNIEIDDTIQDRIDSAIDDVKTELLNYLEENPDTSSLPCISNDLDYSGAIHEIIDGSVPIYTKEIEDTWYLHSSELEEAYENSGIGDNPRENNGMVAIYCYIEQAVHEWYRNEGDEVFDQWKEGIDEATDKGTTAGRYDASRGLPSGNTPNPYGTDTEAAKHSAFADAYEDAFEEVEA